MIRARPRLANSSPPKPRGLTFTPLPAPTPFLNFGADSTSLPAGACTNLHWASGNVQSVFLDGAGVDGAGTRNVCPPVSTPYNLVANYPGGQLTRQVNIVVTAPSTPPNINSVNRSTDTFYEVEGCGPVEVTFSADISGAAGAQLFFRVLPSGDPPGSWTSVGLTHQAGNTWVHTLHNFDMPAPMVGDVEYYVTADNAAGPSGSPHSAAPLYSSCKP
jgi:hypothetical protein